jgi:phage terminase small subunit
MWDSYTDQYIVIGDAHAEHLLATACLAFGELLEAQRLLAREGLVIVDRWKQPHAHPAAAIARGSRFQMLAALKQLGLDVLPQGKPGRPSVNC